MGCHSQAAHVALIKVVRDKASDSAKVVEVKMLRGMPKNDITACDTEGGSMRAVGMSAMNQFRALMGNRREIMPQQQLRPQPQVQIAPRISQEPSPMRRVQQFAPWQPQMEIEPSFVEQMPQAH